MALMESGREGVDWIELAEDRMHSQSVVNMIMNLLVP
jgi:hypothetical protein